MKFHEIALVVWIALAATWVLGNVAITYYTGVAHTGEPNYDRYHETKSRP